MRAYRVVFAIIGWAAIVAQYWLMIRGRALGEIPGLTVNFLSFFTILTNLLAALALTLPVVASEGAGRWWNLPAVRAGIVLFTTVVMAVYHLVLRATWDPQGLQKVVDYTLHYGMPLAFILDWLLFVPKGRTPWSAAIAWLGFPAAYGVWTLVHGALSGFYPYPFLDVTALGYGAVVRNMAGMTLGFLVLAVLLVALDRMLGRRRGVEPA